MTAIDLNADLGEGDAFDVELLEIVSSCNIACGGHAGDDASMRTTVAAALRNNVAIGAHPSYPDPEGFGRVSGFLAGDELRASFATAVSRLLIETGRVDSDEAIAWTQEIFEVRESK